LSLRKKQSEFVRAVGNLIRFATERGYELTFGDAWAKTGHMKGSKHYSRLAIDLNLFKQGRWLTETEDHTELGEYWESIGGIWGGRFKRADGNHYEWPL
jgi:hypothetical protein